MANAYLDALKKRGSNDLVMKPSETKQAMLDQNGRCAKCGKEMNKIYAKYQRNPITKKMEIICMHCTVTIPTRK